MAERWTVWELLSQRMAGDTSAQLVARELFATQELAVAGMEREQRCIAALFPGLPWDWRLRTTNEWTANLCRIVLRPRALQGLRPGQELAPFRPERELV